MNKETIINKDGYCAACKREIKSLERKEAKTFTDDECPPPYTEQAANAESLFLLALLGEI